MDRQRERQTEDLANSYLTGRMSRRAFVTRLLALGLAPSAVAAIVAAFRIPGPVTRKKAALPGCSGRCPCVPR